MAKLAVDVVLLPSQEMMDKAIEANRRLLKQCADEIVLDKENCLPHISLAMGCIDEKDMDEIVEILQGIAEQCTLGQLRVTDIHIGTSSAGEKISAFEIERSEDLQSLHEEVTEKLGPYLGSDVSADMVCGVTVAESTLLWVRDYREKSSFEKFFPHITIGYGEVGDFSAPMEFTAPRLALCHLGNHCTCRKVLTLVELKSRA